MTPGSFLLALIVSQTGVAMGEDRCREQDEFVSAHFDRSDWMGRRGAGLASTRLLDVRMVGSHNTASYTISEPFDEYSVCQNADISSQLMAGVRYVDLRVAGRLRAGHGPHTGAPLPDLLARVARFVEAHPREFLVLSVKGTGWADPAPDERYALARLVATTFSDRLVTSGDRWFDQGAVTMGALWGHGRSVLVLYDQALLRGTNVTSDQAESWGLMARHTALYDPWANTDRIDTLFERMDTFYETRRLYPRRLYVAELLLTADPLQTEGIDGLTSALQATGRIDRWLREHPSHNIVLMDFVLGVSRGEREACVALLDRIINHANQSTIDHSHQ